MESKIELRCNDITFCCNGFVEEVDDKYYNILITVPKGVDTSNFMSFIRECGGYTTVASIVPLKDVWVKIDNVNKQVIYPKSRIYECDIDFDNENSPIRITMFYGMVN